MYEVGGLINESSVSPLHWFNGSQRRKNNPLTYIWGLSSRIYLENHFMGYLLQEGERIKCCHRGTCHSIEWKNESNFKICLTESEDLCRWFRSCKRHRVSLLFELIHSDCCFSIGYAQIYSLGFCNTSCWQRGRKLWFLERRAVDEQFGEVYSHGWIYPTGGGGALLLQGVYAPPMFWVKY